jgi:phage gp46-like protein
MDGSKLHLIRRKKKFTRSNNNLYAEIKNLKRLHKHTKKKIKCFN